MKSGTKLVLALVAAFALGGAVVEGLHAQAKARPVYYIAEVDVTNLDAYSKEFASIDQEDGREAGRRDSERHLV